MCITRDFSVLTNRGMSNFELTGNIFYSLYLQTLNPRVPPRNGDWTQSGLITKPGLWLAEHAVRQTPWPTDSAAPRRKYLANIGPLANMLTAR